MGPRVLRAGLELDHALEVGRGRLELAEGAVGERAVQDGRREIGVQMEGLAQVADGLLGLAPAQTDVAQGVVERGVAGVLLESGLDVAHGSRVVAQQELRVGAPLEDARGGAFEGQRRLEGLQGPVEEAVARAQHAHVEVVAGLARLELDGLEHVAQGPLLVGQGVGVQRAAPVVGFGDAGVRLDGGVEIVEREVGLVDARVEAGARGEQLRVLRFQAQRAGVVRERGVAHAQTGLEAGARGQRGRRPRFLLDREVEVEERLLGVLHGLVSRGAAQQGGGAGALLARAAVGLDGLAPQLDGEIAVADGVRGLGRELGRAEREPEVGQGGLAPPAVPVVLATVVVRSVIVGVGAHRCLVVLQRAGLVALAYLHRRPAQEGVAVLGVERDGLVVSLDGALEVPLAGQGRPHEGVGRGELLVDAQGGRQVAQGRGVVSQLRACERAAVQPDRRLGASLERGVEVGEGLLMLAELAPHTRARGQQVGVGRGRVERGVEGVQGLARPPEEQVGARGGGGFLPPASGAGQGVSLLRVGAALLVVASDVPHARPQLVGGGQARVLGERAVSRDQRAAEVPRRVKGLGLGEDTAAGFGIGRGSGRRREQEGLRQGE